jgi:hypothetical protein
MKEVAMLNSYAREVEKGNKYYNQPFFRKINDLTFQWNDGNVNYTLTSKREGGWQCECIYARNNQDPCGHARALEKLINDGQIRSRAVAPINDRAYTVKGAMFAPRWHSASTPEEHLQEIIFRAQQWREAHGLAQGSTSRIARTNGSNGASSALRRLSSNAVSLASA